MAVFGFVPTGSCLASATFELAKVSPDVKEFLKQEEMKKHQQDLQSYLEKLKKDSGVEILDENLKPKQTAGNDAPQILPPATGNPKPVSK